MVINFSENQRPKQPILPDGIADLFDGLYPTTVWFVKEGIFLGSSGTKISDLFVPWQNIKAELFSSVVEFYRTSGKCCSASVTKKPGNSGNDC